jgi:iron complex outermembrane receptor protein
MTSFGAYAEYRRPIKEDLSITTGFRVDRIGSEADPGKANSSLYLAYHGTDQLSRVDAFPSGSIRLDYQVVDNVRFSFGAGSAVQVPEPSERYFALKRMGSDWVGNPGLLRSRNNGIDGTVALRYRGIFLDAGIFHNWVSDFVILYDQERLSMVPGVMNNQARSYMNSDARLFGGELNVGIPLEDRIFLSADLSYVRGTKDIHPEKGISSKNLAEIPPLRSRFGLRYDDGRFFCVVEGILSARQDFIDLDLDEEETPSWGILNLQAGIRHEMLSATVGISNLFNRYYYEHLSYQRDPFRSGVRVPEPGRHLFVNLAVDF